VKRSMRDIFPDPDRPEKGSVRWIIVHYCLQLSRKLAGVEVDFDGRMLTNACGWILLLLKFRPTLSDLSAYGSTYRGAVDFERVIDDLAPKITSEDRTTVRTILRMTNLYLLGLLSTSAPSHNVKEAVRDIIARLDVGVNIVTKGLAAVRHFDHQAFVEKEQLQCTSYQMGCSTKSLVSTNRKRR
jgi:hypothetical protein